MSLSLEAHGVRLGSKIGKGSFGEVYECMYEGVKRAVKRVPTNWTTKKHIDDEVKILKKLTGQHQIVNLIAIFKTETKWDFVFELMGNGHLYELLDRKFSNGGRFTEQELLTTFMDIVVGVKAIHDMNIIHRDLKPENVLVDERNRLKICDFGLSIMLERDGFIPYNHADIGILQGIFIADEILARKHYDKRCDIWGIGVILYKMATGDTNIKRSKPNLSAVKYSDRIKLILNRMLQKDPLKRINSRDLCCLPTIEPIFREISNQLE